VPGLDEQLGTLSDAIVDLEEKIEAAPIVSPTKAAVMFLIGLSTGNVDDSIDGSLHWIAGGILPVLRPHLSGLIARQIDDLIEHPEKPNGKREFWTCATAARHLTAEHLN
jgi:hypothetical protein